MNKNINVAVVGYGKMGKLLGKTIEDTDGLTFMGAIGPEEGAYASLEIIQEELQGKKFDKIEVVVDFSHPDNLQKVGKYAEENQIPLIIATTGFSQEQVDYIEVISKKIPVVYTANFSLGITIMNKVLKEIAPVLKESFDMEVIEKHHNQKIDSPSGTAKMLLKAINSQGEFAEIHGREGSSKRQREIGVHAIRGGTIAGEHTVIFAGEDEILELTHKAESRKIFALGAVKAVKYIVEKPAGLYTMDDVLFNEK